MSDIGSIRSTEDLIQSLSAATGPAGRLLSPWWRYLIWLALAGSIAGSSIYFHGLRSDIDQLWPTLRYQLEFWTSAVTGLVGAYSAFMLVQPDRDDRWAVLPLPFLGSWLLTLGGGCYMDFVHMGPEGLSFGTSWHCFGYILETSFLMALPMVFMLRHAGRIRPGAVILCAGLSVATLSSAVLTLFHDLDTALMVLIWHGSATVAVCVFGFCLRGPAFFISERIAR